MWKKNMNVTQTLTCHVHGNAVTQAVALWPWWHMSKTHSDFFDEVRLVPDGFLPTTHTYIRTG